MVVAKTTGKIIAHNGFAIPVAMDHFQIRLVKRVDGEGLHHGGLAMNGRNSRGLILGRRDGTSHSVQARSWIPLSQYQGIHAVDNEET